MSEDRWRPESRDDFRALAEALGDSDDFATLRDVAFFRLIADGGRIGVLAGLTVDAWEHRTEANSLACGSGLISFSEATRAAVDRYLEARTRHRHRRLAHLWLDELGKLTVGSAHLRISNQWRAAGFFSGEFPEASNTAYRAVLIVCRQCQKTYARGPRGVIGHVSLWLSGPLSDETPVVMQTRKGTGRRGYLRRVLETVLVQATEEHPYYDLSCPHGQVRIPRATLDAELAWFRQEGRVRVIVADPH